MNSQVAPVPSGTYQTNKLAVGALILAVISASGVWFFGVAVLAVFAVGAGHVSLAQIKEKKEKGRIIALMALGIGYGLATWALVTTLSYVSVAVQQ